MEIDGYIRDNLLKGFSEDRIRQALIKAGYGEDMVDRAFDEAGSPGPIEQQKSSDKDISEETKNNSLADDKARADEGLLAQDKGSASQDRIHVALYSLASFLVIFSIPGVMLFLGQFAVYANYIWTLILSIICGLVSMFLIEKSADDRSMIKASTMISLVCAIAVPLCLGIMQMMKTGFSMFDGIIRFPDPIITGVIIFVFYNTAYIIEELRKKNIRMIGYYGIGFVIVLAVVVSSKYLMRLFS